MGSPPPVNFPSPSDQAGVDASAGFTPAPSGPTLCGFGLPGFKYNLTQRLPAIPAFPPTFAFFLGLNCDLANPIDASFAYGGGRVPNLPPGDPEDD
jgi:hypothetical protein